MFFHVRGCSATAGCSRLARLSPKKKNCSSGWSTPNRCLAKSQSTRNWSMWHLMKIGIWPKIKLGSLVEVCLTFNQKQIWKNEPKTLVDTWAIRVNIPGALRAGVHWSYPGELKNTITTQVHLDTQTHKTKICTHNSTQTYTFTRKQHTNTLFFINRCEFGAMGTGSPFILTTGE